MDSCDIVSWVLNDYMALYSIWHVFDTIWTRRCFSARKHQVTHGCVSAKRHQVPFAIWRWCLLALKHSNVTWFLFASKHPSVTWCLLAPKHPCHLLPSCTEPAKDKCYYQLYNSIRINCTISWYVVVGSETWQMCVLFVIYGNFIQTSPNNKYRMIWGY